MVKTNHATVFCKCQQGRREGKADPENGRNAGLVGCGGEWAIIGLQSVLWADGVVSTIWLGMGSLMDTKVQFCCWEGVS
jgi:hypothetical protein